MDKSNKSKSLGVTPLHDRVLIKPIPPEMLMKKSLSGIIIPDTVSKEKPEQGTVAAIGNGKYDDGKLVPLTVKIGDQVVFSKYGYDEVKVDGEEYYIVSESNILAIIK